MSEATPPTLPAGGWVILTKLRSDLDANQLHPVTTLQAAITAWTSSREFRGEKPFYFQVVGIRAEIDPSTGIRLYGHSPLPLDVTKKILEELASILTDVLGQKQVEIYVAGECLLRARVNVVRPPDMKMH